MSQITVAINGALGKMGKQVTAAVCQDPKLKLVGVVDIKAVDKKLILPDGTGEVPLSVEPREILEECRPQVLVDFTIAEVAMAVSRVAAAQGVNLVIGTSGLSDDNLKEIGQLAKKHNIGVVVAPNFAIGAVVLLHLARIAAKYFDYAEIIELHHQEKADAPSGTALATARAMTESRGKPFETVTTKKETLGGCRGGQVDGVSIHSVRLQGLVASQEVLFGAQGQILSLRHDTMSRDCFMPGVILAIKEIVKQKGLVYGIDTLLGLKRER
jgi:4-hydroxy-tetrahydrodipicolinate reductase